MPDKIADKIRKLLALAESANEHEAALAASMAQELMLRHAISEADVRGSVANDPLGVVLFRVGKSRAPAWEGALAQAMADPFLCQVYRTPGNALYVAGRASARDAFIATWAYLRGEIMRLAGTCWETSPDFYRLGRHAWTRGFCYGCVNAVSVKLAETRKRIEAGPEATGSVAIVLASRGQEVLAFLAGRQVKIGKPRKGRSVATSAFEQGKAAGQTLDVSARQAPRALAGGN